MLDTEPAIEKKIQNAPDPLAAALLYARTGNYIDFAALSHVDPQTVLSLLEDENTDPLDPEEYGRFLEELKYCKNFFILPTTAARSFLTN